MVKNYISITLLAFICAFSITQLSAQEKQEKYKVVVVEMEVDENGNKIEKKVVKEGEEAKAYIKEMKGDDNSWITEDGKEIKLDGAEYKMIEKQAFKMIVKDDDGNEKILEWDGEGEMPLELRETLEKEGMTDVLKMGKTKEKEINVNVNVEEDVKGKKKVKIKTEEDGKLDVMEFEIEGDEIPEDLQKILDQHGIDLEIEEKGEHTITMEKNPTKETEQEITVDVSVEGDKSEKKTIKIRSENNGDVKVMEFEIEGDEIPADVQKILDENGIDLKMGNSEEDEKVIKVFKVEEESSSNKPQLGVLIEDHPQGGVLITDVLPETSADIGGIKKGDIVVSVNGNNTKELKHLQEAIASQKVGDKITVELYRDGEKMTKEVILKKKVSAFEFETWDEVMKNGKTKIIKIEKEIKKN